MSQMTFLFVDTEALLTIAGDYGRYQLYLIGLFGVINVISAYHYFGQTFIALEPEHECKALKDEERFKTEKCFTRYKYGNFTVYEDCTEWDYSLNNGYISLAEELNWVCNDNWKPALGQSMFFIGSVIGSICFGILADRKGRLPALIFSNLLAGLGNFTTIFTTNIYYYSFCRFIAGAATDTNFIMMYIIVMEYIRPRQRTFALNICIGVFYCLASMAVPWTALLLKNWATFLVFIAIPHWFVGLFYFVVPESAQWLVSKGRMEDAIRCLKTVAKFNGNVLSADSIDRFRRYIHIHKGEEERKVSIWGLWKTPKLRRKTLILIFKSMVMTLCYDAIARNVNGLGFSPFITFTVTSATIFPAALVILAIQDKVGRKALAMSALFVSGMFIAFMAIILLLCDITNPYVLLFFIMLSRFAIIVAYNSGAQYAVELIPTEVRGQGVSVIHLVGYVASFFSPQILYLGNYWRPLPEIIIGILLICGSFSCLFLPETLHKRLPVTLEDGEAFGANESIFTFAWSRKKITESTCEIATKRDDNLSEAFDIAEKHYNCDDNVGYM